MDGDLDKINGGDVLFRVNEEPFPVECNYLDSYGFCCAANWFERVKLMCSSPSDDGKNHNNKGRNCPPNCLDFLISGPLRLMCCVWVPGSVFPDYYKGSYKYGDDDGGCEEYCCYDDISFS